MPLQASAMSVVAGGYLPFWDPTCCYSRDIDIAAICLFCLQTDPGHLEKFQAVLKENPAVFHTCRTATSLHHHWVLMGHNGLLNNQKGFQIIPTLRDTLECSMFSVDLIPPEENIKEFSDAEDRLEDTDLM